VATVAVTVQIGDGVDAARRTSSETIASEASHAVEALDAWERTPNPVDYVRFVQSREQTATMTARALDVTPGVLRRAWADASAEKQHAVLAAVSQLGVPYKSITSNPGVSFDCSGLTIWAFSEAGVELPRVSRDQIRAAESVDRDDAGAGDLMYYPGHVGIYVGAGLYVHSPEPGHSVEVTHLPDRSLDFGDPT
jgi:cell wall-associated NlpC family hydrolase